MLKNPFEGLVQFAKDKTERDRKTNEFIHVQTDSLITWLVGFAFAALSLIASNIASIKSNLETSAKPIIVCLFLTIIIGIAYRYVSFLVMIFQKNLDNYFVGVFGDFEITPFQIDPEIEGYNHEEIVKRIKDDFNEVISYPRELTEEEKKSELPRLINHYKLLCDHSKNIFQIGIEHIAEINETAYKIKKQQTINQFNKELKNPRIGYNQKKWDRIRTWLYTLCLASFIVAVSIVFLYLMLK